MVDLENLIVCGLYTIVIAVASLPPSVSALRSLPESEVLPEDQDFLDDVRLIVKLK